MNRYRNGGTIPLVPEGRWGEGVYMPGEAYETEATLGPPWVLETPKTDRRSKSSSKAVSGPQDAPQGTSDTNQGGNA